MFFQLFSTITVKIVDKMMQNANLCVILHFEHKKYHFLRLVKYKMAAKMAIIVGDVTGLQERYHLENIQSNLFNADTKGTEPIARFTELSVS